ncbi:MAG: ADP-ribosylglycohydrolase family protein [Selenomonadaceae bacterium]|nr:ADP-ribosylglycohydrolase family protein [Selenomonadaceae bacterium]
MNVAAVRAMIIGSAVGDALGVPVEFMSRESLAANPVKDMRGFGTHNQPPGTWSDDTSMTLCLLASIGRLKTINYDDIMKNFVKWMKQSKFTATGEVFDIGIATHEAISRYLQGAPPLSCGGKGEYDNGNGSLMRIAPLALYACERNLPVADCLNEAHSLSRLTHAHPRSQMACGIYTLLAVNILRGQSLYVAIRAGLQTARKLYASQGTFESEVLAYNRLWDLDSFVRLPRESIKSSGYVIDTLEAVIWCLMNTASYADCVLKAVNLGDDTDTVGAIVGGLAGITYGLEEIPSEWLASLRERAMIEDLCQIFARDNTPSS